MVGRQDPWKQDDENTFKGIRVAEEDKVDLEKWPPAVAPKYQSKDEYKTILKLSAQQQRLQASIRHAIDWLAREWLARFATWIAVGAGIPSRGGSETIEFGEG